MIYLAKKRFLVLGATNLLITIIKGEFLMFSQQRQLVQKNNIISVFSFFVLKF